MPNTLLTPAEITREALFVLENNLVFTKNVNREYDPKFGIEGAKIGTVLNIRKPIRYIGRTGALLSVEDATETSVPVSLDTQFGVDVNFTSVELGFSIDRFSDRILKPAVATIANKIDKDGLTMAVNNTGNFVGAPGTVPNALLTYLLAGVKLDDNSAPVDDERYVCVSPLMEATIVDALKGLFQSSQEIAKQYRKGRMGTTGGFTWYMDQNAPTHVFGVQGGAPLVNGVQVTGSVLSVKGATATITGWAKKGDKFTIATVNALNPQSRDSTGSLQQFTVLADANSTAGGIVTLSIFPPMYPPTSAQATVTALPTDGLVITWVGTTGQSSRAGVAFHRDAFTLACADLPMPKGVDMAGRMADEQVGLSIRMVRDYDINNDKFPCRLDVLYGWAALRAELACVIWS
jgi:hypothetical protein